MNNPTSPPAPPAPVPTQEEEEALLEQARNEAQARVADVHVEEGNPQLRRGAELAAS